MNFKYAMIGACIGVIISLFAFPGNNNLEKNIDDNAASIICMMAIGFYGIWNILNEIKKLIEKK